MTFSAPHPPASFSGGTLGGAGVHPGAGAHASTGVRTGVGIPPAGGVHSGTGIHSRTGIHSSTGIHQGTGIHPAPGTHVSGAAVNSQLAHHAGFVPTSVANQFRIGNHNVAFAPNHYHPAYYNHPWYHGYWNHNHWGGYPGWGWGYGGGFGFYLGYPLGWGYGGWGLGVPYYTSGYLSYYNPYWSSGWAGYNYAQPIPVAVNAAPTPSATATDAFSAALASFKAGDYASALALVDQAIAEQPTDAPMHEFRALVLFALQEYPQAAATIHSVLAVGPGWDWTTMSSFYASPEPYTAQLRALENYVELNPDKADGEFLLAYHYMTAGHTEQAAALLQQVVQLLPSDRLATDLLRMTGGAGANQTQLAGAPPTPEDSGEQPPDQPLAEAEPVDPAALTGSWRANRDDGSKFNLTLKPDKTFTWKFSQKDHSEVLTGTYGVEQALLILQSKQGGAMLGQVTMAGDDSFNFKMPGAPPDDPGLTFTR
jgi:tetratricopeptide (TPR) repeat protein